MHIAVIGAGPSGSRAGAGLARLGHDVTLFDRTFDREKPCGGGVPAAGLSRLFAATEETLAQQQAPAAASPADRVSLAGGFGARAVALEAPSGARACMDLPGPLTIFSRRALDRALLETASEAGARLVEEPVAGIERTGLGSWRLRLAGGSIAETDHLVGADGARSAVRRAVGAPFAAADLSQAVGWYVPGRSTDVLTIRFDARIDGYLWIFPRPDHLAVGACAPLREGVAESLWQTGRDLLRSALGITDAGLPRYSALIPTLGAASLRALRVAGEGWSLVGDAAGTVDPITREGIRHGLDSADLLVDAFAEGHARRYGDLWKDRFEADFTWAAVRRARFFAPELTERFVRYVGCSRAVRAVLADLVLGDQDYLSLRRRLVRTALPLGADLVRSRARSLLGAQAR